MLSYRHAFHAGNFADVHKHAAWVLGIHSLHRKPAPFCLIDAYAGAGAYDLRDPVAQKTGEWRDGIGRVLAADDPPDALGPYLEHFAAPDAGGNPGSYPGSPALAAALLRAHDRLVCLELHPSDYPALKGRFHRDARVHVHRRDAREGLPALVPPPEKRGLVLIDPPYEQSREYADVPRAILAARSRWPTGSYLLWYPLLADEPHVPMLADIAAAAGELLVQELRLFPDAPGLRGSGLAWINPPWQADIALAETGEWLCRKLGGAQSRAFLEWRKR